MRQVMILRMGSAWGAHGQAEQRFRELEIVPAAGITGGDGPRGLTWGSGPWAGSKEPWRNGQGQPGLVVPPGTLRSMCRERILTL